jgi:hypothetical protein
MAKEFQKLSGDYRRAGNESFSSMVRSAGDVRKGLQGISSEWAEFSKKSVGQAIDMQAQLAKKAFDTYISELSKFSQMGLVGYDRFLARAEDSPKASSNEAAAVSTRRTKRKSRPTRSGQRTAAQTAATHRKMGAAERSGAKKSKR